MNSAPLRLIVFDCDGTLVDSQSSIVAAMHATCDHHGMERFDASHVRHMVGLPLAEAFARLVPSTSRDHCETLCETYKTAFFGLRQKGAVEEPLYPGTLEALDAVEKAGWLMAVATGKSRRGALATLGEHDLVDRFLTLQTADYARGKPHPEMMHNAMNVAGTEPKHSVMIGDTSYDMEMARSAGAWAIGVSWGYHDVQMLTESGAHVVIDAFADLHETINTLLGA